MCIQFGVLNVHEALDVGRNTATWYKPVLIRMDQICEYAQKACGNNLTEYFAVDVQDLDWSKGSCLLGCCARFGEWNKVCLM